MRNSKPIPTLFAFLIFNFALAPNVQMQIASGGGFTIEKSVVATGGGTSSGDAFTVTGTTGQTVVGTTSSASLFAHRSGFWTPDQFAPTAARVSVGGRVSTSNSAGIRSVIVTLTDTRGAVRTTFTGAFGMYRFTDVEVGETYVLTVRAKRYVFSNPSRVVSVQEELTNLDFIADRN